MKEYPINFFNEMAPGGYWNDHMHPGDEKHIDIDYSEDYWQTQV
jgi:hypothetical protein